MANKRWNPHTGRRDFDIFIENFHRLCFHLPLLFRVAAVHEDVDMRDNIESDLLCEIDRLEMIIGINAFGLKPKLIHIFLPAARDRLIGRHNNALDFGAVMQRLKRNNHLDGRAIWIGNDAFFEVHDFIGIYLWHDERDIGVHAPC